MIEENICVIMHVIKVMALYNTPNNYQSCSCFLLLSVLNVLYCTGANWYRVYETILTDKDKRL